MSLSRKLMSLAVGALFVHAGFGLAPVRADFGNLFTQGHADIAVHYEGGTELELGYELGSNAVINGVPVGAATEVGADYLTAVIPNASFSRFDGGVAGLPGVFGSNTFWYVSQPNPGAVASPWIGIGAEEISTGIFVGETIGMSLKSVVSAPQDGEFIIYRTRIGGFDVFIDTQNLGATNSLSVPVASHRHFYFGFSQPGTYLLEFEAVGNLIGGGQATGSAVYAFNVVPEPSAWMSMSIALVSIGFARRYRLRHAVSTGS